MLLRSSYIVRSSCRTILRPFVWAARVGKGTPTLAPCPSSLLLLHHNNRRITTIIVLVTTIFGRW